MRPARRSELVDLTLHRGDASVALAGSYARASGELTARVEAERVDAPSLGPAGVDRRRARPRPRALDVARRGGQWQADATLAVAGLALAPGATAVDASAHLVLARRRATLDASATGPALGELAIALDTAAPGDPFDPAAWRRLDRAAIHTAAITARRVRIAGLAGLIGPARAAPQGTGDGSIDGSIDGTVDGSIDLAPAALRGELAVRGVALPFGALDGD